MVASSGGREHQQRDGGGDRDAANSQASGVEKNDNPASASLWPMAIAAAGPRNANTRSAEREPGGEDVVGHPKVVVGRRLPEPCAADVEPQLVCPALEAGVAATVARLESAMLHAEHGFAAEAFHAIDAAHQVDEHDAGEEETDDRLGSMRCR